jgi:protein TonB
MQRPDHDLRIAPASQATPRRLISLGLVGIIHIVLIYAIVSGLSQYLVKKGIEEIKVATGDEKPDVKPPPPFVPPPDIVIETVAPVTNTITTQDVKPTPPAPPKPVIASTPVSIGRPHTCGNVYPDISIRMKEEGTTTLALTVNTDGSVSNVSVANSSGSSRLDDAAVSCASRWRYKAATQEGQPVSVSWKAAVQWVLPK